MRARKLACLLAVLAAGTLPSSAAAQGTGPIPDWPELLPPNPFNSAATVYPGFDVCPSGSLRCPRRVILQMYERWRPLSHACDHRAVFALTYLRTTEEFFRTITAEPTFFDDPAWINHEDAVFADLYFRAYDDYHAGRPVPGAWEAAFENASNPNLTAFGDLLLGMSAHINRDLAHTLAAVGLVPPGGGSRKTDHDRVNYFLDRLADPLQDELGDRYDDYFRLLDTPTPFDEEQFLAQIRGYRQNAWQNAEHLVNANSNAQRQLVTGIIETQSTLGAQGIIIPSQTVPGWGARRDAWCEEHNTASARVRAGGRRIGRVLARDRLRLHVFADGPARFRVRARVRPPSYRTGAVAAAAKPRFVKLTRPRRVRFGELGRRRVSLKLTEAGRRALDGRPRARVKAVLRAPYGLRVRSRRTLVR